MGNSNGQFSWEKNRASVLRSPSPIMFDNMLNDIFNDHDYNPILVENDEVNDESFDFEKSNDNIDLLARITILDDDGSGSISKDREEFDLNDSILSRIAVKEPGPSNSRGILSRINFKGRNNTNSGILSRVLINDKKITAECDIMSRVTFKGSNNGNHCQDVYDQDEEDNMDNKYQLETEVNFYFFIYFRLEKSSGRFNNIISQDEVYDESFTRVPKRLRRRF